jgi:hypothetical protein
MDPYPHLYYVKEELDSLLDKKNYAIIGQAGMYLRLLNSTTSGRGPGVNDVRDLELVSGDHVPWELADISEDLVAYATRVPYNDGTLFVASTPYLIVDHLLRHIDREYLNEFARLKGDLQLPLVERILVGMDQEDKLEKLVELTGTWSDYEEE